MAAASSGVRLVKSGRNSGSLDHNKRVAKPASAARMLPINTPFCTVDSLA
jgi:hypothetical protein